MSSPAESSPAAEAPAVLAEPQAESAAPASSSPAPLEAASAALAALAVAAAPKPTPAPSPLGKAEPFPHMYEYRTDTVEMDQKLGDVAIKEPAYTEAELALMEQLREAVAKMILDPKQMACTADDYPGEMHVHWTTHWPEGKGHALYTDNVSQLDADSARWPHHELIRFLRARNMDLKKATKMYFHFKRWRLTFGASHIASLPSAPWEPLVGTILSASFHKWDKLGRPIYIQKSGGIDVNRFTTEVSVDKIGIGHTWFTEEMCKRAAVGSKMRGERVTQLVMVIDIAGLGLSARKLMKIFSTTAYIDQNFMPEYLGCMYIINSPSFFPVIFSLAKVFLSAETQRKIKILGKNYAPTLVGDLGAEALPVEYGGSCVCPGGCCPIPSGVAPPRMDAEGAEEETFTIAAGATRAVELALVARVDGQEQEAFWSLSVAAKDVDLSIEFIPHKLLEESSPSPAPAMTAADAPASPSAAASSSSSSASAASSVSAETILADSPHVQVLPVTRVVSSPTALSGVFSSPSGAGGVLHLTISNSYSRWNSKTVTIRTGTRNKAQPAAAAPEAAAAAAAAAAPASAQ